MSGIRGVPEGRLRRAGEYEGCSQGRLPDDIPGPGVGKKRDGDRFPYAVPSEFAQPDGARTRRRDRKIQEVAGNHIGEIRLRVLVSLWKENGFQCTGPFEDQGSRLQVRR